MIEHRVRALNAAPTRPNSQYVLYWMQMNRRARWNQALEYAVDLANRENLPLLVYEGLTCSYPFASDRFHTFILEGAAETQAVLAKRGIGYFFYLRRVRSDPNDVLYHLAAHAAVVVTDDYPAFVTVRHNASVSLKLDVAFHAVDASCVVPMNRYAKREWAAYTIRPRLHRMLAEHMQPVPHAPLKHRYTAPQNPLHTEVTAQSIPALVASCQIDHGIAPSVEFRGGSAEAHRLLNRFLEHRLRTYDKLSNQPAAHSTSDLSPYLHFGQISALEIALAVREHAAEHHLMADGFLEELIVRRELAFNFAHFTPQHDTLDALPDWARETLRIHANDPRPLVYSRAAFETARTHDPLWNATQRELLLRGKIHGYYRMYWGKKIIEWSATPQDALNTMIFLNDRYTLDGRDPNTYTNILWCFGLHDRAWNERAVFGKVRYMGLEGMKRKTDTEAYIREVELL